MSSALKYFSQTDFQGANPPCSIGDMCPYFLARLDYAREIAEVPFVVNSAYRTTEHEHARGRDGSSSHTKGIAIDIRARTSQERYKVLKGLMKAGFVRIGIAQTFIHVDTDKEKAPEVVWTY